MWKLSELVGHALHGPQTGNNGIWVPARPIDYEFRSLRQKFGEAWRVFKGELDCFEWPQAKSEGGRRIYSGISLILRERERQKTEEGYELTHDDLHIDESLARAAAHYALPYCNPTLWPESWNPSSDKKLSSQRRGLEPLTKETMPHRIRDLVKAGALVAAEIDRLQRIRMND